MEKLPLAKDVPRFDIFVPPRLFMGTVPGALHVVVWLLLCVGVTSAATDPGLADLYWGRRLKVFEHEKTKTFPVGEDDANFTWFEGVTAPQVVGGVLRFELTQEEALLGWGNYDGEQLLEDIEPLWPEQCAVRMWVRQSGGPTQWKLSYRVNGEEYLGDVFDDMERDLIGNDWQVIEWPHPSIYDLLSPTPDGLRMVISGNVGDVIEIEQLQATQPGYSGYYRKEFDMPAGDIWHAIADIAETPKGVKYSEMGKEVVWYINGEEVLREAPWTDTDHTYPADIAPYLNPGETNCVAVNVVYSMDEPHIYFQSEIVLESGASCRWQTDDTWTCARTGPAGWNTVGFDDAAWEAVTTRTFEPAGRAPDQSLPLPSYQGLIRLANPFRKRLVYREGEEVVMDIRVPPGLGQAGLSVDYQIDRANSDGSGTVWTSGTLNTYDTSDQACIFELNSGLMSPGVYSIELSLRVGATVIEERWREPFMVMSVFSQDRIVGENYAEGMTLDLEDSIDFTDLGDSHPSFETAYTLLTPEQQETFIPEPGVRYALADGYGKGIGAPSIVSNNGLVYRETWPERASAFSYRLNPFQHPGDYYLMELDYPDDTERDFDVTVCSREPGISPHESASGVSTGGKFFSANSIRTLRWIHVADEGVHSIDVINNSSRPGRKAAASSLRVHHIGNELPAVRLGSHREIGIHTERCTPGSGIGMNFGLGRLNLFERADEAAGIEPPPTQAYIRDLVWMHHTAERYVQYLKFSGQNTHIMGCFQYDELNTPCYIPPLVETSRLHNCMRAVLASALSANDIGFYAGLQVEAFQVLNTHVNDAQVAKGADTVYLVNKSGHQMITHVLRDMNMNIVHPDVREKTLHLIDNVARKFKDEERFEGVYFIVGYPYFLYTMFYYLPEHRQWPYSVDDRTFSRFEQDTGIADPGDPTAPDRFEIRDAFLSDPAHRADYVDWRCQYAHELVCEMLSTLQTSAGNDDLKLVCPLDMMGKTTLLEDRADDAAMDIIKDYWIDPQLYGDEEDVALGRWAISWQNHGGALSHRNPINWRMNMDPDLIAALTGEENRHVYVTAAMDENFLAGPDQRYRWYGELMDGSDWIMTGYKVRSNPQPAAFHAREAFTTALIRSDPNLIAWSWSDANLPQGHDQVLREFSRVYTALPREQFQPVLDTGVDTNLAIRALARENETFLYVANPGYWPITGAIVLDNLGAATVRSLPDDKEVPVGSTAFDEVQITVLAAPPPGDAVSYWPFDEDGGVSAADVSGDNDGVLAGEPQWVPGKYAAALKLDGAADYVNVPHDASLNIGATSFSFNAWISPEGLVPAYTDHGLFGKYQDDENRFYFRLRDENTAQFYAKVGGMAYNISLGLSEAFTNDQMQMVTVVFNRSENKLTLYRNAEEAGSLSDASTSGVAFSNTGDFTLGAASPTSSHFDGTMDDVRWYNSALTEEEIGDLYEPPLTGSLQVEIEPAGAVTAGAQWRLDDGQWHDSGAIAEGISIGNHVVSCKEISGWLPPSAEPVDIQPGLCSHVATFLRNGDFDQNGHVDFWDFMDFVDTYGLSEDDPGWNADCVIADFDDNGMVDFWDFMDFVDAYDGGLGSPGVGWQPGSAPLLGDEVSYWALDEGSGATAADSVGPNDGTLQNAPRWGEGHDGHAIFLDRNDDYIGIPHHDESLNIGTASFSFNAWIAPEGLTSTYTDHGLFGKYQDEENRFYFRLRDENTAQFYARVGGVAYNLPIGLSEVFKNGQIQMISVAFNRSENKITVYRNAQEIGDVSDVSTDGVDFSNAGDFTLGAATAEFSLFGGMLDDVRWYGRALTEQEIADLYDALPVNNAPDVDAGPDQALTLPDMAAQLDGTATDDGLPHGTLTTTWSVVSGPGTVVFGDANAVDTTATFDVAGIYVLRLEADDGQRNSNDEVRITIEDATNAPPSVDAGPDQIITAPDDSVYLDGTVSDDGLPSGTLAIEWTVMSGPGTVTFQDANSVDTTATFSTSGVYTLRLTADDGDPVDRIAIELPPYGLAAYRVGSSEVAVTSFDTDPIPEAERLYLNEFNATIEAMEGTPEWNNELTQDERAFLLTTGDAIDDAVNAHEYAEAWAMTRDWEFGVAYGKLLQFSE